MRLSAPDCAECRPSTRRSSRRCACQRGMQVLTTAPIFPQVRGGPRGAVRARLATRRSARGGAPAGLPAKCSPRRPPAAPQVCSRRRSRSRRLRLPVATASRPPSMLGPSCFVNGLVTRMPPHGARRSHASAQHGAHLFSPQVTRMPPCGSHWSRRSLHFRARRRGRTMPRRAGTFGRRSIGWRR